MAVIGVDIGGTKISAGIVKGNRLIRVITQKNNSNGSKDEVIHQVIDIINQLFDSSIGSIGIGVPAIVDLKKGILYESVNIYSWRKVPLKQIIEKKFKVPVAINNDANCFALGEKYFGKGKHYNDIVGLIIGTGVGAGIIINKKLYCGNNCGAGEFGKIPYLSHNVEYYCSGQFFQKEYNLKGEELCQKLNKKSKRIFEIYGRHLGKALSMIVNSVDPQIIILGGGVSKNYNLFKDSMLESLKESVYRNTFKNIRVDVSSVKNVAILGAASLCFDSLNDKMSEFSIQSLTGGKL